MILKVPVFERLFREVASLDVDRSDLKRLSDLIRDKIHDLLVVAEASARQDGRDIMGVHDLPITKGLQESLHRFRRLEVAVELQPVLEQLATLPAPDLGYDEELAGMLPELAGTLAIVVAQIIRTVDPTVRNPSAEDFERASRILHLTL